ncbi:hypothetical protein [Bacillus sp. FJAT-29814]|uniref:hypothetical protein n=1 Tax=Bacillus sp. FJAT-29814 TaxID=1729688 RepID=UPI000A8EA49B|nr:hypothetical protein [Bacillus sp. FJAT-29814]
MFIPTKVNIGEFRLGTPDHKSAVSVGTNLMHGVNVAAKKSQGFGQQMADGLVIFQSVHITFDDEIIDMPSIKKGSVFI